MLNTMLRGGAAALAMTSLLGGAALAQTHTETGEGAASPTEAMGMSDDQPVATVGNTEITGGDLARFIEGLPAEMQEQPPELLMSMSAQQLILRELLLQKADAENLSDDAEVQSLTDGSGAMDGENAMIRVYLDREMETRVTDEAVQALYDEAAAQAGEGEELPPLADVRPQIEQQLQREAIQSIQAELAAETEVTIYGPDGEPIEDAG
ncbi:hypothetical protein RM543_00005 [Roseicyclus sp. F158]|uniref:Peptidylprolyl isomerase n=1 Tax=Tropicimonas omnivorans TaxID=3075590 RepID=A0ABU3DBF6_9RHOB|nr:hypothetical protein [Roseicyclus sp. F158]MDT0681050.1 hypothetical protein [Roseicyclus sp. F158]